MSPILQADPGQVPVGAGAGPLPNPTPNPTGQEAAPTGDLSNNLTTATRAAPGLKTDPGTAVAVAAGGGDVGMKAQAVQQAKNHVALAEAAQGQHASGGLGGLLHDATSLAGDALNEGKSLVSGAARLMNVPLRTVQQEYRYLHDVEARHGATAAVEEGLGILAGAAAGTVAEPGEGTILGAEAAAWLEGHASYKDSWQRAANPNYRDPHTGQLVSFGRDVADALGARTGSFHSGLSGALDAMFDLGLDPMANTGKAYGDVYSQEGARGLLGKFFTGTSTATAEDVARASMLPRVKLAFADIARSDAGTIAVRYPGLAPIALTLEQDSTAAEVRQTFMELAGSMEMMEQPTLPTLSLGHLFGRTLRDAARNAGGPLGYLPRTIADALESQPGNTLDPESLDFMKGKVSMTTNDGAKDLYRFVRFGQGDRVARATVDAFLHGTPGERYTILKNSVYSTLLSMAKMRDPGEDAYPDLGDYMQDIGRGDVTNRVMEMFANHMQAAMAEGGDPGKIYGTDELGNVIAGPVMPDGSEIAAGITSGQTGDVSLPNLVEARRMAQAIRSTRVRRVLAGTDDFVFNHYTQGIWKPLELMSLGYGFHISLSEAIPNTLRTGIFRTARTMYSRALSKMDYQDLNEGDVRGLAGWLWRMGGQHIAQNSEDAQALTEAYLLNEGYRRPVGLTAGEITRGETQPVLKAENGLRQIGAVPGHATNDWAQVGNENSRFAELHWSSFRRSANDRWSREAAGAYLNAAREGKSAAEGTIAARNAVADALRDEPPEVLENYARNFGKRASSPDGWDNITDWADSIVSRVKGLVHGRPTDMANKVPGPINMDLLHSMANGHTPDLDTFENLSAAERPLRVEGQIIVPSGDHLVNKIANVGFKKILDPMVNAISRNQEFAVEYLKQYKDLQPAVDRGVISDEERVVMANYRAVQHGVRFVHNLTDRTQWTTTMRNWAPFYFAQEQAYRRMGRFLVEDPGGFRRYQMAISAVSNVANSYADGQGNQYITFPGSGWLGTLAASMMGMHGMMVGTVPPAQFGGSLSSASVIFPMSNGVTPELGPLGTISAEGLSTMFQQLGKTYATFSRPSQIALDALNAVDHGGGFNQSILEQVMPNATIERMVQLYEAQHGGDSGFNSSVMQTYQMLAYMQAQATAKWEKDGAHGQPPHIIPTQQEVASNSAVAQNFVQTVKHYVTTLYIMRAVLGFASPISAEVEPQNFGFSKQLQAAISSSGSVAQGFTKFLTEHPNALSYTVAESFTPGVNDTKSGYSLSSSVPAQNWVADHRALLDHYGPSALWLMPQLKDAKYSPAIYNEQIADHLRQRDTPQQFLNQLYIAAGDSVYYKNLAIFEQELTAAGKDSTAKNAAYDNWNAFVAQMAKQYPVWYQDFSGNDRQSNALNTIQNLQQIFASGQAPPGEQTDGVKVLLNSYEVAATEYQQAGTGKSYSTQQYDQSQVSHAWTTYLDQTAASYPNLKPIIDTVFKNALKVKT